MYALLRLPRMNGRAMLTALPFEVKKNSEEERYREYVTDALYSISQSTARQSGAYMEKRFLYLIHPELEDRRTGDEIAVEVIKKAGLIYGSS